MISYPKLRKGLLSHRLEDQLLVYDPSSEKIHLLDPATASVFEALEFSQFIGSVAELEHDDVLALSLDELRKADLLDYVELDIAPMANAGRRELLKKLAAAGLAAVLIPAITTLTASHAYGQGSCTPIGSPCTTDAECCIGTNGGRHCHHIGTDPPGNFCHNT